jgi:hypothetical protein
MSIADQNRTNPRRVDDPDLTDDRPATPKSFRSNTWRETKPSPKTTELWLTILGVAALVVIYNASRDASLDLFRACLLGTVMAAAYVVSRGFAKAGSHDTDDEVTRYQRQY